MLFPFELNLLEIDGAEDETHIGAVAPNTDVTRQVAVYCVGASTAGVTA